MSYCIMVRGVSISAVKRKLKNAPGVTNIYKTSRTAAWIEIHTSFQGDTRTNAIMKLVQRIKEIPGVELFRYSDPYHRSTWVGKPIGEAAKLLLKGTEEGRRLRKATD